MAELLGLSPDQRQRWRVVNMLNRLGQEKRAKAVGACGRSAAWMRCTYEGRELFKVMRCGRQECPSCGVADSEAHRRRIARVRSHLGPARAGGRFVFTLPPYLRELVADRKAAGKLAKAAYTVVARVFGEPEFGAVTALHFYGDRRRNWLVWNPHVELLVPGDWRHVPKAKLAELREEWGKTLERTFRCKLKRYASGDKEGKRICSVYYKPRRKLAEFNHSIRYALRPTVGAERFADLARYRPEEAERLLAVTNRADSVRYFGAMSARHYKATLEKLHQLAASAAPPWWIKVESGEHWTGCPCCGSAVEFVGTVLAAELERMNDMRAGPRGWLADIKREPPPESWEAPYLEVISQRATTVIAEPAPAATLAPSPFQLRMWRP